MSANDQDHLYSWLNARGTKTFKPIGQALLAERCPEYAKIGLPAHKAALDGNVEALKDIYTSFTARGVPSRDVNGATPLHLAVRCNRIEAVKWLLRFTDLSPTISAKHGETPCHVAAVLGNTECLKAMLGADVKGEICVANDNSGFTPLHLAIVKSRNEVAKLLISELGAKGMGPVTDNGITAAHVAASAGNVEVLKIIASKNKKYLSQETLDGTTPLYYAAQEGRLAVVKFLYEKGKCDVSSPSNDGRKPIHAACQCGHTHVVKYIVSQLNNSAIFDTAPDGATTLHFAASTGQVNTVRWLIDSDVGGILVNSKDSSGDTPAHDAADNGKIDTLKLLLESGADLYAINNDGNTPYSLALSSQTPGMADFVMSFASNAPQKQNEGPSQMTIFDMQGEVDVVDFTPKEKVKVEAEVEVEVIEKEPKNKTEMKEQVTPSKKEDKKSKKKEKEKKEKLEKKDKKQKDKKGKKNGPSGSFLQATGAALLAIPPDEINDPLKSTSDDKILDMTEEELDMFKENGKVGDDEDKFVSSARPSSSDGGEIVVSYGESTTPPVKSKLSRSRLPQPDPITISEYSTVAEIERAEKKKEKKKQGRKNSKSIQKKKHEDDSSKNVEGAGAILSGSQMGFKPQFKTNPLQRLSAAGSPPTPPPTPATGFSSSATSEAGMISTEDEDDMPYDMYTNEIEDRISPEAPNDKTSSVEKEEVKKITPEENIVKDIDNTITNLDDEEEEEEDDEEEEDKKPVLKKWPPPKVVDYKPEDAKIQPSGENVLKKWQPTESDVHSTPPGKPSTTTESKTRGNVMKKWPPAVTSEPNPPAPKIPSPLVTAKMAEEVTSNKSPPQSNGSSMEHDEKRLPVKLNPVQKVDLKNNQKPDEVKQTEFDKIKLKKATKAGSNYSSPSREVTSGADNELSALLKLRQNKI